MKVKLDILREEFKILRDNIREINPNFTVNLITNPKIMISFNAPSFYEVNDLNAMTVFSAELITASSIIKNFKYNNYDGIDI